MAFASDDYYRGRPLDLGLPSERLETEVVHEDVIFTKAAASC